MYKIVKCGRRQKSINKEQVRRENYVKTNIYNLLW